MRQICMSGSKRVAACRLCDRTQRQRVVVWRGVDCIWPRGPGFGFACGAVGAVAPAPAIHERRATPVWLNGSAPPPFTHGLRLSPRAQYAGGTGYFCLRARKERPPPWVEEREPEQFEGPLPPENLR